MNWPVWWDWELEITPHIEKRMIQRGFTEVDLRTMLHGAIGCRADVVPDRSVVEARHRGRAWEIIVEPDYEERRLVVITAYSTE